MTLREILNEIVRVTGMSYNDVITNRNGIMDYEVRPYEAGEQGDEVVRVDVTHENKTIELEYE